MRSNALIAAVALALSSSAACTDAEQFDTAPNEAYCGAITVANDFRQGLSPRVQMRLRLDGAALVSGASPAGTMATFERTDDRIEPPLVSDAPLRRIAAAEQDALSQLDLGEGRETSMVFQVIPAAPDESPLLAILSLRPDDTVEVRLLRGGLSPGDPGYTAGRRTIFGLFTLTRKQGDCGF